LNFFKKFFIKEIYNIILYILNKYYLNMWARSAQLTGPSSTSEEMGQYRPKMVGPISTQNFSFFFWVRARQIVLAQPKFHVNYMQQREHLLFTCCMQPNGCKSCWRAEEEATSVCGHGRDQEVKLMFQAASFRWTMEELVAGGRGSRRRKRQTRSCREER